MNKTVAAWTLVVAVASPATAGIVFKQVATSGGEKGFTQTTRVSIDTGGARIDFLDSGNPMLPAGGYMLVRPDDDAMIIVNPKEKTWAAFDVGAMMGAMKPMMNPGGAQGEGQPMIRSAGKPTVEKLLEESGGPILGRPTKHFRWHTVTSTIMDMGMGMAMTMETDSVEDSWVAEMPLDAKVLRALSSIGGSAVAGFEEIAEARKDMHKGLPMKHVVVSTTKSTGTGMMAMVAKKMNAEASKPTTMTMEIVELSEEKVPASTFSIPADYSETEMMSPGMKMPDMNRPPG